MSSLAMLMATLMSSLTTVAVDNGRIKPTGRVMLVAERVWWGRTAIVMVTIDRNKKDKVDEGVMILDYAMVNC